MTPLQLLHQGDKEKDNKKVTLKPFLFSSDEDLDDILNEGWPFTGDQQEAPTFVFQQNITDVSSAPSKQSSFEISQSVQFHFMSL